MTLKIITIIKYSGLRLYRNLRNNSGLTLFEVVIAIAISSLILIMVYTSHRSVTSAVYQLTGIADFYENVNLAIDRIDKDISCAYFTKDNKNVSFIGESDYEYPFNGKINFVTTDHNELSMLSSLKSPYPRSDIKEVGYSLKQDEKFHDLFFLQRREESHYDDEPETGGEYNIILENVLDIKFEFKQGNTWTNKWDSRDNRRYPAIVRTTLKIRNYNGEEEEFVFLSKLNLRK